MHILWATEYGLCGIDSKSITHINGSRETFHPVQRCVSMVFDHSGARQHNLYELDNQALSTQLLISRINGFGLLVGFVKKNIEYYQTSPFTFLKFFMHLIILFQAISNKGEG